MVKVGVRFGHWGSLGISRVRISSNGSSMAVLGRSLPEERLNRVEFAWDACVIDGRSRSKKPMTSE